ncbi:hypothetical protein Pint_03387 [Pistacia integerrima]
MYTVP